MLFYRAVFYFKKNTSMQKTNITESRIEKISKIIGEEVDKLIKKEYGVSQSLICDKFFIYAYPNFIEINSIERDNYNKMVQILNVFVKNEEVTEIVFSISKRVYYEEISEALSVVATLLADNMLDESNKLICNEISFLELYDDDNVIQIDLALKTEKKEKTFISIKAELIVDDVKNIYKNKFNILDDSFKKKGIKDILNRIEGANKDE